MVKAKPQKAKYAHNPRYGEVVKKMATIIETTFESFGITVIVMEINNRENDVEFLLEVEMGTSLENISKLHKDLAMALASPTGDIEIEAPVPGTCRVALRFPMTSNWVDSQVKKFKIPILLKESKFPKTIGDYLASFFYIIAAVLNIPVKYLIKLGNYFEGRKRQF